jgi:hypothetical protein
MHARIEVLLEMMFYTRSVQRGCKEDNWGNRVSSVREAVRKRGRRRAIVRGAAVQRGLEPGSRRLAIVGSRYQVTTTEDTEGWKIFVKSEN